MLLRKLQRELRPVFEAGESGDVPAVVGGLNGLLARHPITPQISDHDAQDLHLHVWTGTGSVAEQLVGESLLGLSTLVCDLGADRLGVCSSRAVHQRVRRRLPQPVAALLLRPLLVARQRRGVPCPAPAAAVQDADRRREPARRTVCACADGSRTTPSPDRSARKDYWGVVLDSRTPRDLGRFYAALLEWEHRDDDEDWVTLSAPDGVAYLAFHLNEQHIAPVWPSTLSQPQQQLHLDFEVDDLEAARRPRGGARRDAGGVPTTGRRTSDARPRRPSVLPLQLSLRPVRRLAR